jgi:hypothetical protein
VHGEKPTLHRVGFFFAAAFRRETVLTPPEAAADCKSRRY